MYNYIEDSIPIHTILQLYWIYLIIYYHMHSDYTVEPVYKGHCIHKAGSPLSIKANMQLGGYNLYISWAVLLHMYVL